MPGERRRTEYMPLAEVMRAPRNPKKHDAPLIAGSMARFGVVELPAIDERTGRLVAGHGRLDDWTARRAAGETPPDGIDTDPDTGDWLVPVTRGWASRSDADAEAYLVVSNQTTIAGGWEDENLAMLLADIRDADADLLALTGFDQQFIADNWDGDTNPWDRAADGEGSTDEPRPTLADRFLLPPFDVLDARQGVWQDRKRQWLGLGITSEIGRGQNLAFADISSTDPSYYDKKNAADKTAGRTLTHAEFQAQAYPADLTGTQTGTSIFDPVLCELIVRWFSAPGATVLDPFAGGSVRAVVTGTLGRAYVGNDLSADQVEANRAQVAKLVPDADVTYTVGDSAAWVKGLPVGQYDLVMTCPPYYDLETYSNDPADLSAMGYDAFDDKYADILLGAVRALRPHRFAAIVVGDARDSRGNLHDLRGSTVRAMEAAGCHLVTAGVLVTPVGSAAMRATRQFVATRTLARCHQDVLIFIKGSRQDATNWCGDVDVADPATFTTSEEP